jgi:Transposase/DDE superfamily endonuclease
MVELEYKYKASSTDNAPIPTMRTLSSASQNHILSLLEAGHTAGHIAASTGYGISTVSRLRSNHLPHLSKSLGGRPSKLSSANIRHAQRLISSGKADTAVDVAKALRNVTNQPLSAQTVRRNLKAAGLKAVAKKKKPFLSKRHRKARMDFALAHQHWTVEDWKKVVWSDETKINRLGSDGRKWVWKKAGEGLSDRLVQGTQKFGGGSVMVWGCMLWDGPGYACRIDGRMDGDLYIKILEEDLQESLNYYGKDAGDVIFQQDNDSKHTCKKAQTWFQNHDLNVLLWPAQSPDLNPIEHLWDHLKRKLAGQEVAPRGILELWERVEEEWNKIDAEVCQNLIESMPRRVAAVLKAKGGYTKY